MNFGEVRRAQLAKSSLLNSTLLPLGSFQNFKVCSDAKERVGCGNQQEATTSIQSLVNLQAWFLSLRWKACLRQNSSLDSCACSEGPALGQNTLMIIIIIIIVVVIISLNYYHHVHRGGAGGSMRASPAAGRGSIPGLDKLPR